MIIKRMMEQIEQSNFSYQPSTQFEMQVKTTIANSASFALATRAKDYFLLIKFTLSFMVVFSTVVSFLIAPNELLYVRSKVISVLLLFIGGMLITGSANAINQVLEKDTDALMKRTAGRPVASGRMSAMEATIFAIITGLLGFLIFWYWFNFQSALVALAWLLIYGFVYTPLKKINSVAVLVGAIPGALPCLIGWVAATGNFSIGGWVLFGIQFLWQFPHFWAIAWLAHQDYTIAGFKLLPGEKGPTKFTALQTIIYSAMMIPFGFLPYLVGLTTHTETRGIICMAILFICNLWMVYVSILLFKNMDVKSARKVMFSSYFYLMFVLLTLFLGRP